MEHIFLLDYQQDAIDNTFGYDPNNEEQNRPGIERTSNEPRNGLFHDGKRMVADTVPTGGGKSFIAMESMIQIINEKGEKYPVNENKPEVLSNISVYYYYPNNEIKTQYATHMLEYIVQRHYRDEFVKRNGNLTIANVNTAYNEIIKGIFAKKRFSTQLDTAELRKQIDELYEKARSGESQISPEELSNIETELIKDFLFQKVAMFVDKQKSTEIVAAAKRAFPNLEFKTYQSIATAKGKDPIVSSPDLFIYDEFHCAAAPTRLNHCIDNAKLNPKSYFLCLSATPERDGDDKSVVRELAKYTGYSMTEIINQDYYAKELYLADAIEKKILVKPEVIHPYYMLDETKEYKEFMDSLGKLEKAAKANPDEAVLNKLKAYKAIQKEVYKIIGREEGLSDEEWKQKKIELFRADLDKSSFNKHGKFIYFIPPAKQGEGREKNYEEHIKFLTDYFGDDVKLYDYYTETGSARDKNFDAYKAEGNQSGPIKILVACNGGSQGLHIPCDGEILAIEEGDVKGNDKALIDNKVTARNSFMQKIGRCFKAVGKKLIDTIKRPTIVDMRGCFGRNFNHLTKTSDVFEIPKEEKCFYELMEIADKVKSVSSYTFPTGADYDDYDSCNGITFKLARGTKKYTTISHIRRDINGFSKTNRGVTDAKKQSTMEIKPKFRFEYLITVLRAMKMTNPDFDFSTITESSILGREFVTNPMFYENLNKIAQKQGDSNVIMQAFHSKKYELGKELETFRKVLIGIPTSEPKVIKDTFINMTSKDVEELADLGFFSRAIGYDELDPEVQAYVRRDGFIAPNSVTPECMIGINLNNGRRYYKGLDEFGCDKTGYDKSGFDRYGFNRRGFHRATGAIYDERFFKKDERSGKFINIFTGTELDPFGYNHDGINPETGFDIGVITEMGKNPKFRLHKYHRRLPDGSFSRGASIYSDGEPPIDFFGFRPNHTIADNSRGSTESIYTYSGFCYDGTNYDNRDNSYIVDRDSKYYRLGRKSHKLVSIEGVDLYEFKVESAYPGDRVMTKTDRDGVCNYNMETGCLVGLDGKNSNGQYPKDIRIALEVLQSIFEKKESAETITQRYGKIAHLIKSDLTMLMALTNMHKSIRESIMKDESHGRGFKTLITSLSPEKMREHANEFIELNKLCPSLQPQIVTQTLSNREAVREKMNMRASRGQIFGLEDSRGE